MRKHEMAIAFSRATGLSLNKAKTGMTAVFDMLAEEMIRSGELRISGFGIFKVITTRDRRYKHPVTGEMCTKPVSRRVIFKPLKMIVDRMRG